MIPVFEDRVIRVKVERSLAQENTVAQEVSHSNPVTLLL